MDLLKKILGKILKDFIKNKDKRFHKYLNYFLRNWAFNKSYNFNRISNTNYERRTNNICESFHRTLNNQITHSHPKISYLVEKLKFYCYEGYKKYTNSLVNNVNLYKSDDNNIAKDIFNFIKSFH